MTLRQFFTHNFICEHDRQISIWENCDAIKYEMSRGGAIR